MDQATASTRSTGVQGSGMTQAHLRMASRESALSLVGVHCFYLAGTIRMSESEWYFISAM